MEITLRDTIKNITRDHLNNGYQCYGQCLTAVGFVNGTVPDMTESQGLIELSMADVAGGGFVTGAALMGKRPFYIIRYQGFTWYNMISVINYACKSKEMWGIECPMFIRSIAMEGSIGPVAGSSHHSTFHRMPGIEIYSPMTPMEYRIIYNRFMASNNVMYVSEHRGAYNNTSEMVDIKYDEPDVVLFPISITRFNAVEASNILIKEGIKVSVYHLVSLKPFLPGWNMLNALSIAGNGIVLDDDYPDGIASTIAQKLMIDSDSRVYSLGLKEKTAGFAKHLDNLPPTTEEIVQAVRNLHEKNRIW